MKFLFGIIILSILVHLSYGIDKEQAKEMYNAAVNNCKTLIAVSEGEFEKVKMYELPETREGKCFSACIMKTTAFMNAVDHKPNKAVFMIGAEVMCGDSAANMKIAEEIIDACIDVTDADECEAAYIIASCLKAGRDAKGITLKM